MNQKLTSSMGKQSSIKGGREPEISEASQADLSDGRTEGEVMTRRASGKVDLDEEPARTGPSGHDECATNLWERALRSAREGSSLQSSGQSFRSSFGQLPMDHSREEQYRLARISHDNTIGAWATVSSRQSWSFSSNAEASRRPPRESFNLERHQLLCVEAKKPLTRSASPARSVKPKKKSLLDIRRITTAAHQSNSNIAKYSPATITTPGRDFLAWARFPSHTRNERNAAAGKNDAVSTRDFFPPTDTDSRNCSKLSLMTQPGDMGVHTPGSWRFLKIGHGRKKSRSMNFEMTTFTQTNKEKDKGKQKHAVFTMTRSLARWKRLYRSHSSDLRRFRAGHRSSVSKGGKVEFPELEIVPGYDGGGGDGGRVNMEQLGDYKGASRKQNKMAKLSWRGRSRTGLERQASGSLTGERSGNSLGGGIAKSEWARSVDVKTEKMDTNERLSSIESTEQSVSKQRGDGCGVETGGTENAWAEIYQDCLVKDDESDRKLVSSSFTLPAHQHAASNERHKYMRQFSASGSSAGEGEDSYVSYSVGMSDDDVFVCEHNNNNYQRQPGALETSVDGACDIRNTSRVLGTADGGRSSGMEKISVLSSELRDSTVDFRAQLEGEEKRVREALLKAES